METIQIYQDLKSLRLTGMANSWEQLVDTGTAGSLSLYDGLTIMIQGEKDTRKENRTKRLIKAARFRYVAYLEDYTYDASRGRDKGKILQLASCDFVNRGQSVLITGPTGVGKSYTASMLGFQACNAGFSVAYYTTQKLMEKMRETRVDGMITRFFDKMSNTDLLVIEDFGLAKLDGQQLLDFMELIEDRHARKSTIITSQLPLKDWYQVLDKNASIADAVLDRLLKTSIKLELSGDSMRK